VSFLFDLLGYRNRWRLLERLGPAYISETSPIVIGGCGSSGTTLVRRMLNRHPAISCGPESTVFLDRITGPDELAARMGFVPSEIEGWQRGSRSQAEFIDRFQAACLSRARKRVWADKTPENIRRLDFVWRHFPRARFVHVFRDGRDVACSLRRQDWMKPRERGSADAIARCAAYWVERVSLRHAGTGDPRYAEVRYEDLVRDPAATLRSLLAFLELDWSDRVLTSDAKSHSDPAAGPAFASSVGRWRTELSEPEIATVKSIAGELLIELGYETNDAWGRDFKAAS
jgi:protein-tyrosine sulfotransferase